MKVTDRLIHKFLQNSCTAEEAAVVTAYFRAHPDELETYLPADEWEDARLKHLEPDQESLRRMLTLIKRDAAQPEGHEVPVRRWRRSYQQAAVWLLLTLGIGLLGYYVLRNPENTQTATKMVRQPEKTYFLFKINASNQPMILESADGSAITLYPGSEIRYPEYFDTENERHFDLKGKARFRVAPGHKKPFVVNSGRVSTTALGTDFMVTARRNEKEVRVSLYSGRVVVQDMPEHGMPRFALRYLNPGDVIAVDTRNFSAKLMHPSPAVKPVTRNRGETLLTDSTIRFKDEPLTRIFAFLEKTYDVRITCDKSWLKDRYYSGTFNKTDRVVEDILTDISLLNQATIELSGNNYMIKKPN